MGAPLLRLRGSLVVDASGLDYEHRLGADRRAAYGHMALCSPHPTSALLNVGPGSIDAEQDQGHAAIEAFKRAFAVFWDSGCWARWVQALERISGLSLGCCIGRPHRHLAWIQIAYPRLGL